MTEIIERCPASISGMCLSMVEGFGHCGPDGCDYGAYADAAKEEEEE